MKVDYSQNPTAGKGRNGDKFMAHIAEGETIVPPVISDDLRARLYEEMKAAGIDPEEYTVGQGMSINPETGLPEFGFFKSIGKFIKKASSVVLPQLGAVGGFTNGLIQGQGLSGALRGGLNSGLSAAASILAPTYLGPALSSGLGLSGLAGNSLASALASGAVNKVTGSSNRDALLQGGISGLGSFYQGGGFNNVGKSFNDSGLSGALAQLGDNISGKGDVLSATSSLSPNASGGGESSYNSNNPTSNTGDLMSGRGLNSILSAGIGSVTNSRATDQLLKQQKQGLAALQPYLNHTYQPTDLANDPGYQFQLEQGTKALDSANAARGNYFSGDALRSAGAYAQGLANTTYKDAFDRDQLQNQSNIKGILSQYGIQGDIGNTQAASTINQGNILTDSLANYLQPEDPYAALLKKYLGR